MQAFMIGLWGRFDEAKYRRDLKEGFYGAELCQFPHRDEVNRAVDMIKADGFRWGCHYPLLQNNRPTRDPLFLSPHEAERNRAFDDFETEARLVAELGGQYILAHFPKPVLLSEDFDFTRWRFGNDQEWIYEKDYPRGHGTQNNPLRENLHGMFDRLSQISEKYALPVVLENDWMPASLLRDRLMEDLLESFHNVRLCLDIARLHLQETADPGFDGVAFAAQFARYAFLLHLSNTSPAQNAVGGHLPVSPLQKPEDGYADVQKYLKAVCPQCPDAKILFEHRSELLTDGELADCYRWVTGFAPACHNQAMKA